MSNPKINVSYVAGLARIALTPEEEETFQKQLGEVVTYVEQLSDIDISSVPDTPIDPHLPMNVLRQDILKDSLPVEETLQNSPARTENLIVTPKIVE